MSSYIQGSSGRITPFFSGMQISRIIQEIEYPGQRAVFELSVTDWYSEDYGDMQPNPSSLIREMYFRSVNSSLIGSFRLSGHFDGKVRISIYFSESSFEDLKSYFSNFNIEITDKYSFTTKNKHQLKVMFEIINKHNEIPFEYLELIYSIINSCPDDQIEHEGGSFSFEQLQHRV